VIHVVAERFTDLTDQLGRMREEPRPARPGEAVRTRLVRSRDFH
jgi:error-prone DNA polymerase